MRFYPLPVLMILAACSDPKAATKSNFKAALADHFAHHCIFITPSVGLDAFPVTVTDDAEFARFDALATAGLLTSHAAASEHAGVLGIGTVREQTKTYDLTDTGRARFQNGTSATDRGFCAGHYRVDDVRDFTPPVVDDGRPHTDVTFDVTPELDDWVKNDAVQQRYGDELGRVRPTADRLTLVGNDHGWAVADAPLAPPGR